MPCCSCVVMVLSGYMNYFLFLYIYIFFATSTTDVMGGSGSLLMYPSEER